MSFNFVDNETFKSKLAQYEDSKSKETMLEEFESQLRQSDRVQKNLKKMLLVSLFIFCIKS